MIQDGTLAGLWRVRAKGKKAAITVEELKRIRRRDLKDEAERIAELRAASDLELVWS